MADIIILTEQTHEIAVRKKYGAGAISADQRRFLAEMRIVAGNPGVSGCFAYASFAAKSINITFARAKPTGAEKLVRSFYFFLKQPAFKGFDICGLEILHPVKYRVRVPIIII